MTFDAAASEQVLICAAPVDVPATNAPGNPPTIVTARAGVSPVGIVFVPSVRLKKPLRPTASIDGMKCVESPVT